MSSKPPFDEWYDRHFGGFPGSEDPDNRIIIRAIWNSALEHAAELFAHDIFEELPGNAVADRIRSLKTDTLEKRDGIDHI